MTQITENLHRYLDSFQIIMLVIQLNAKEFSVPR